MQPRASLIQAPGRDPAEPLDESDASGNITAEYVYFGGKRIAWRDVSGGGNIYYYVDDMLGRVGHPSTGRGARIFQFTPAQ